MDHTITVAYLDDQRLVVSLTLNWRTNCACLIPPSSNRIFVCASGYLLFLSSESQPRRNAMIVYPCKSLLKDAFLRRDDTWYPLGYDENSVLCNTYPESNGKWKKAWWERQRTSWVGGLLLDLNSTAKIFRGHGFRCHDAYGNYVRPLLEIFKLCLWWSQLASHLPVWDWF